MAAHQARLSLGFSRQEYWSGLPLPSPTQVTQMVKNLPAIQDTWVNTWVRKIPSSEEGNGYPLQHSCLENSMDRRSWQATDLRDHSPWGLQFMGSQKVGRDWVTFRFFIIYILYLNHPFSKYCTIILCKYHNVYNKNISMCFFRSCDFILRAMTTALAKKANKKNL